MPQPTMIHKLFALVLTIQFTMAIVFVTLKVWYGLSWSWWQVTTPLWAPWGMVGTMVGIVALIERVIDP